MKLFFRRRIALSCAIVVTALISDASGQTFAPPVTVNSNGVSPGGASTGDFNGDGRADLVVANYNNNILAVFIAKPDGTYELSAKIPSRVGPIATAIADLNHDGNLDFLVTNVFDSSVSVHLGKGDGTFQPISFYAAGVTPTGIALGDYNGDGFADVAVCNANDSADPINTVQVLLGKGDGTLLPPVGYNTGSSNAFRIATGDFNNDGKLDLVVTEQHTNAVRLLIGQGDGTFVRSPTSYSVAASAGFVAVADFNRDGKADFVVTSLGSERVAVFLGRGDFNFDRAPDNLTGTDAATLQIADFNGDGSPDIVVDSFAEHVAVLKIFLSNGDGTFQAPTNVVANSTAASVAVGDFNADGKSDLVAVTANKNTFDVFVNTTAFPAVGNLANISTRLQIAGGDDVLIAGFIVQGSDSKRLMVRAIGPDLGNQGVSNPLQDPTLELRNADGNLVQANDNWRGSQEAEIIASGLAPQDDRDSAIIATVSAGSFTAVVRGAGDTTGVGLVEGYDLDSGTNSRFANISTRGFVSTGDNVMIGGFIVPNGPPSKVVVRGIGPSLLGRGVAGAMTDPTLELHGASGNLIYANDNWRATQSAEIFNSTLAPIDDRESAIFATLPAGAYTAILRGKDGTTGVGLVEVYQLP
jgi:hypothetical protein